MYFQSLQNIVELDGENKLNEKVINEFDYWLASRREAVKSYLSPYSFSQFSNVDIDLAMDLFYFCTTEEIDILKVRYDVFIRSSNYKVGSFFDFDDIPSVYEDPESEIEYRIMNNDILVYFELTQDPIEKPEIKSLNESGKPRGVGVEDFKETESRCGFVMGNVLRKRKNG